MCVRLRICSDAAELAQVSQTKAEESEVERQEFERKTERKEGWAPPQGCED